MKYERHPANDRGRFQLDWLDSRHTFSFGEYYNPNRMSFGQLRVINDDIVQPEGGFATHSHRDMEIVSIPLFGCLQHKDTLGNGSVIQLGEVQLMSAGTGISHSEFNPSARELVNFLQIWVLPEKKNLEPSYQQKKFDCDKAKNQSQLLVSPDGRDGSLHIHQQVFFSRAQLAAGESLSYDLYMANAGLYVFVIDGELKVADQVLQRRDGFAITELQQCQMTAKQASDVLLIETAF